MASRLAKATGGRVMARRFGNLVEVEAFANGDFDLAFMDVMMPGKNGVDSFLEIKRLKPSARVYMMTGYSVEQLLQQAIDGGAMGVFSKPVNLYQVLETVSSLGASGIVLVAE